MNSLEQLQRRNPAALRLAVLSAFAVRLKPGLLRRLRRRFLHAAGPEAELDLWHSALVSMRGATAALFSPQVLGRLREALAEEPQRQAAYELTLACFGRHPAVHRFEIRLNALPVLDPDVRDAAIERELEPLLAGLRQGGEMAQRAARWLLQAAPRWHPRVRGTSAAWAAMVAASALLQGRRLVADAPPRRLRGEALALPASLPPTGTRLVGVALTRRRLHFLEPDGPGAGVIALPAISPALVLLELDGQPPRVVEARPGTAVEVPSVAALALRSLTGEGWWVERQRAPATAPRAAWAGPDEESPAGPPADAVSDERPAVYLSAAGADLRHEVERVARVLQRRGYRVLQAATFPPVMSEGHWKAEAARQVAPGSLDAPIRDCDVFVCFAGESPQGLTRFQQAMGGGPLDVELEYEKARALDKRVVGVTLELPQVSTPEPVSFRDHDNVMRLKRLRAELLDRYRAIRLRSAQELEEQLVLALERQRLRGQAPAAPVWLETEEQEQEAIRAALEELRRRGPRRLRNTLERLSKGYGSDVTVESGRGAKMVSVSEAGLAGFEADTTLAGYDESNHLFADFFGGVRARWPIVFFLSQANVPGVRLEQLGKTVSVLLLGPRYALQDVVMAIDQVLAAQSIRLVRPAFLRRLREIVEPSRMPVLERIVSLPLRVESWLQEQRQHLLHTQAVLECNEPVDPAALAEALGLAVSDFGVLDADAGNTFWLTRGTTMDRQFATPQLLGERLANSGLRALLGEVKPMFDVWHRLPARALHGVPVVLLLVEPRHRERAARLEALQGLPFIPVDARRDAPWEQ